MCGIAGIVGGAPTRPTLEAMLSTLEHRGPDDRGVHLADDAALGMTRLAIIDLVTGRQPMSSEDGRATLVFNGEIYNFRALRAELEAGGVRFRTQSDTEVILRLWERDGEACVERLRGMFAFAVWDARRRTLFLARDRVGKKPLYYWQGGGRFVFASEIKALLRHPGPGRELDWTAFHHYLAYGYTPSSRSAFEGIAKLPPGHTATLVDGRLTLRRYWQLPAAPAAPLSASVQELGERIRHEIREAVRLRLESDVPLGVFLSGGIDSSVVTASMREVTGGRIATFSIGFGAAAASFDELPFARQVAARFGTDHYEEVLEPKAAELAPVIVRAFDEPFADSSAIATFAVAAATVRHVKVALSGIGGDEAFAGYPRYLGLAFSERWAHVPRPLRRAVAAVSERALPETFTSRNWRDWALRFAAGAELPLPDRYFAWTRFFDAAALGALATPALAAQLAGDPDAAGREAWRGYGHGEPMDGAFRVDLATYLPDDLLVMADRMSMAHSLELRAPFCDHQVVETSLAIAPSLKTRGLRLKGLLKRAYADVLPPAVLNRRKQGFMIPLARWLRSDLRPLLEDLLSAERVRARGLFNVERVEALKAEHLTGRRSHADRLWTLMMAELWLREYLDRGSAWTLAGAISARAAARPRGPAVVRREAPSRPLRVLAVSDVSVLALEGGAERGLWEVTRRLAARGHDVRILSRAPEGVGPRRTRREDVDIVEFASSRRSLISFLKSAVLEARHSAVPLLAEADVLHVHQPLAGYGVLTSAAGRRVPSLYTFHSPAPLEYRLRRRMTAHHLGGVTGLAGMLTLLAIERACLLRATRIQVLSDYMASLLWKLYRIPAERIVKIPGAADLERFRPAEDRRRLRAALGIPADRPTLLTVRNLETRMGLDTLLEAMVIVARRMPEAQLLLGGAGSLRAPLEAQARASGLDKHVTFLGYISETDLPRYYQAADAFVLPTRDLEGFGLVTVEALACGTPVLGTRIGATPELLEPLDPALLFGGEGAEAMAADLLAFLDRQRRDPAAAAALRAACARYASTQYGWDRVAAALEATFTALVDGRRRAPAAPAAEPCEACGGPMRDSALLYDGRRYRRCAACRARRVARVPSDVEMRQEYQGRYPRRFPPALIATVRREMMHAMLDRLRRRAAPGRLLDVGCGGGHFMAAAVECHWRPIGADLSHAACAAARRTTGRPAVEADAAALPFRDGTLDAISLVSVLDHTTQPLAALREAARVLRPGGVLVVRVPNGGFHAGWAHVLGRLGPAVRWRDWDTYPVLRVFAFGRRALRRLAERAGFEVLEVVNSALASPAPDSAASGVTEAARRTLRAVTRGGAAAVSLVSGGRWLVGPSIEIYARRCGEGRP